MSVDPQVILYARITPTRTDGLDGDIIGAVRHQLGLADDDDIEIEIGGEYYTFGGDYAQCYEPYIGGRAVVAAATYLAGAVVSDFNSITWDALHRHKAELEAWLTPFTVQYGWEYTIHIGAWLS